MSKTIARKAILAAILDSETMVNSLVDVFGEDQRDALMDSLNKWNVALNKVNKSANKETQERDAFIIETIVPFVVESERPVTAKVINEKFVHSEKTNKASAMLRRAVALGYISRDKVRKNASFEYASNDFDWDAYIGEYDKAMQEKAKARIARANANRSN